MRQKVYNSTTSTWEYVDSAPATEAGVVQSSTTAKLTAGPTAPSSPSEGDVWVDTSSSVFPIGTEDIKNGAVRFPNIDWSTIVSPGYIQLGNTLICYGAYSANNSGQASTFAKAFSARPIAAFTDVDAASSAEYFSYIRGLSATDITIKTNSTTMRTVFYLAIGPA